MKKTFTLLLLTVSIILGLFISCSNPDPSSGTISLENIPAFTDEPYVVINNNVPGFTDEEKSKTQSYEFYSELDALGRCGYTIACIGTDLMPTEDRGSIGQVKPSGWQTVKYDIVDAKYLYNRCHLIGFQLTGENANVKNLITGTRYLNIEGMLPFENMVADYLKENPKNHVLYRATPIYDGYNLVASGVHMEAYSIEDGGEGICFNIYAYNAQPGIVINYSNGMSRLATEDEWNGKPSTDSTTEKPAEPGLSDSFMLNTDTKKIHTEGCRYSEKLTNVCNGTELGSYKAKGYTLCGVCDPLLDEVWEAIPLLCAECKDADDDEKCDTCGADFADGCDGEHKDANDDGKCDLGGENFEDGEEFFALNTSSKKIHLLSCRYSESLTERCSISNLALYKANGYTLCGICKPVSAEEWDAISPVCEEHRDTDDDNFCDACSEEFSDACDTQDCRDENDDGLCDTCKTEFSDGCDTNHKDENGDNICDSCEEGLESQVPNEPSEPNEPNEPNEPTNIYVINTESKKIHKSSCRYAKDPDEIKYITFEGTESELHARYPEEDGYSSCGTCHAYN